MLGMQGQAGQSLPVGQHSMPGQIPGGDLAAQGVIPPTVPHLDGGSALAPHHPFSSSSQTHRQQQPPAGLTVLPRRTSLQSPDLLSGMGSNLSQPFLSQTSPSDGSQLSVHGQAQDRATPTFDADGEGRKRKGTAEADAKRVRQRTGNVRLVIHPVMVTTEDVSVDSPDTTVVSHFPSLFKVDMRCANKVAVSPPRIALLHLQLANLREMAVRHQLALSNPMRHNVERLNTFRSIETWILSAAETCGQSRTVTTV